MISFNIKKIMQLKEEKRQSKKLKRKRKGIKPIRLPQMKAQLKVSSKHIVRLLLLLSVVSEIHDFNGL
jgi:hypothetical protein